MKKYMFASLALTLTAILTAAAGAQAPAGAPAGANGICKDGTYSMQAKKEGACRGHKGVQTWYVAAGAAPAPATVPSAPAMPPPAPAAAVPTRPAPVPAAAPPAMPAPASATPASGKRIGPAAAAAQKTAAPGGGPGMVWLNTDSNVYHCVGTTYYGKTKHGSYMSEADAKAKGAHNQGGKDCPVQ